MLPTRRCGVPVVSQIGDWAFPKSRRPAPDTLQWIFPCSSASCVRFLCGPGLVQRRGIRLKGSRTHPSHRLCQLSYECVHQSGSSDTPMYLTRIRLSVFRQPVSAPEPHNALRLNDRWTVLWTRLGVRVPTGHALPRRVQMQFTSSIKASDVKVRVDPPGEIGYDRQHSIASAQLINLKRFLAIRCRFHGAKRSGLREVEKLRDSSDSPAHSSRSLSRNLSLCDRTPRFP